LGGDDDEMIIEDDETVDSPVEPKTAAKLSADRIVAVRIGALKKDSGSSLFSHDIKWIEEELSAWPGAVNGTLTGGSKLANRAVEAVVVDMMTSLLLAFALIGIMFVIVLRSVRQGVLAMMPNLLPLVLTMGIMSITGLSLRISTVIIFAMCMGVVVDDTIHFLVRFRQEQKTQDFDQSLNATILHAGRPVVFTTMMLVMGFSMLIPSEFNGLRDFGNLSAICISLALLADLLTLPAILAVSERWRQRKAS
jgi:predicted RND superfamily exporter protein